AHAPSSAESSYRTIMESLAKLVPHGRLPCADIIAAANTMTGGATTFIVVSTRFPPAVMRSIAEARRRHHSVSAVHLATGHAPPPPFDELDGVLSVRYTDEWHR